MPKTQKESTQISTKQTERTILSKDLDKKSEAISTTKSSVLDSVMKQITDKQPEKKEIVTFRRYLIFITIGLGIFLAALIFTIFFVDLFDKSEILSFVERSPVEVLWKLTLELVFIATIFTLFSYLLYRKTVLPWAKNQLGLFVSIFLIVLLIVGSSLAFLQNNLFGSRPAFGNLKESLFDTLPFARDVEDGNNFFVGKLVQNTPEYIIIKNRRKIQKFIWNNNYEPIRANQPVVIKYTVDKNQKPIVNEIKIRNQEPRNRPLRR